ncbi:MAG: MlaD family protein [Deltaproteobacteria bacterium]
MKRKVSPFKLGLFVLAGILILMAGMLWIGAVEIFQSTKDYTAVFDFSVGGLQKGAPVKYLGVQIGDVKTIGIGPDDRFVEVVLSVDKNFKVVENTVVQLDSGGIAGQPYLSLVRLRGQKVEKPSLPFTVKYPVIPTRRGSMARMENQAKQVLNQLEKANIPGLVSAWRQTAQELSGAVAGGDIRRTIDNLQAASAHLEDILKGLSGTGKPEQWRGVFRDITATADNLRRSTSELSAQLKGLPPDALNKLNQRIERMVTTGEKAVSSFNRQSDQTMAMLDKSLVEVNRLLAEMERLVRSLRQSPGEILEQPRRSEPFKR